MLSLRLLSSSCIEHFTAVEASFIKLLRFSEDEAGLKPLEKGEEIPSDFRNW